MKKRPLSIALFAAGAVAAAGLAALFILISRPTTLELSVRDAVSGSWVWDLSARIQRNVLRGYYQSDAGPVVFRFKRLAPGKATLRLSAPGYEPVDRELRLRRGANRLEQPVLMTGTRIPGLDRFSLAESLEDGLIVARILPLRADGTPILNHPCLDLWVGCRVTAQTDPSADGERGAELFRGTLEWTWDSVPESQARYRARIPRARPAPSGAPYRVSRYLIVVPDPLRLTKAELDALMARLWDPADLAATAAALDGEKGRLSYFAVTTWSLEAGQQ